MPEIVTKYPAILLKELKDTGGKCGEGARQKILTKCPVDRFCSLPTGEICVYDLNNMGTMTQISFAEWSEKVKDVPAMMSHLNLMVIIIVFAVGVLLGMGLNKR